MYALHNRSRNFIYIGYSENLKSRIKEHNEGKSRSTKAYRPFTLIFYEAYLKRSDAKRRERYLKMNRGELL
ncbi:MAG: GIY-YIG nuclease family protein [Candidatus Chisholmbacteria bacterium]|nr:GIY-YIG nuclease family protein [Candidatus Chisholmbacteria bacterium]